MTQRLDAEARQLVEAVLTAASRLRADCQRTGFRGDRAACANAADVAEQWAATSAARMLERSEDGDDDAHRRLMDTGRKMLAAVGGAFTEISKGTNVADLVRDIARDGRSALAIGGAAAVVVAGIAAGLYLWLSRPAPAPRRDRT